MRSSKPRMFWGRRVFLVDRRFQLKYSLILGGTGAAITGLCAATMHIAEQRARADLVLPRALSAELAARNGQVLWILIGLGLLTGIVLGLLGIVITHRIAGPIYAMTQFVTALARGRYPLVRPLRKSDELKEFFDLFQKSVESLRAREVEEMFRIEEGILKLSTVEQSIGVQEVLASLRTLKQAKLAATGHLDMAEALKDQQRRESSRPAGLPIRAVPEQEVGS